MHPLTQLCWCLIPLGYQKIFTVNLGLFPSFKASTLLKMYISVKLFVGGKLILDVMLIANEAIDSGLKIPNSILIYKPDIKKAYDHIN